MEHLLCFSHLYIKQHPKNCLALGETVLHASQWLSVQILFSYCNFQRHPSPPPLLLTHTP